MKRQKPATDVLSSCRADVDSDDGLDPRDFFKKENRSRGAGRKTQQLCAQIANALQQVFGESGDPILQSLQVVEVVPAPDASQLLILVAPSVGSEDLSNDEAAAALARATGWLRTEVAAAITRKRTPQLAFRIVPSGAEREVQP